MSSIKGLCELANHEVFNTASKGLFERQLKGKGQQDGRFVFEQPLHVDEKDAAEMPQEEYDARFLLCSLLAAVCPRLCTEHPGTRAFVSRVDQQAGRKRSLQNLCCCRCSTLRFTTMTAVQSLLRMLGAHMTH